MRGWMYRKRVESREINKIKGRVFLSCPQPQKKHLVAGSLRIFPETIWSSVLGREEKKAIYVDFFPSVVF